MFVSCAIVRNERGNQMNNEEFFKIGLPKWPQMIVSGKPVTVEQAKDIIFRTDSFLLEHYEYSGGNNHKFNEDYRQKSCLALFHDSFKNEEMWNKEEELDENLGFVRTNYVTNDWASCAYIDGPHGWCSPTGIISYSDNIGKWPSVKEVLSDWNKLATAFPYLNLNVTIMSGEHCEDAIIPLINIRVIDGGACLMNPDLSVHQKIESHNRGSLLERNEDSELGLPSDWYNEFAINVKTQVEKILSNKEDN